MSQIKRYYFDREYRNNYWTLRVGFGVKLKPYEVHFRICKFDENSLHRFFAISFFQNVVFLKVSALTFFFTFNDKSGIS